MILTLLCNCEFCEGLCNVIITAFGTSPGYFARWLSRLGIAAAVPSILTDAEDRAWWALMEGDTSVPDAAGGSGVTITTTDFMETVGAVEVDRAIAIATLGPEEVAEAERNVIAVINAERLRREAPGLALFGGPAVAHADIDHITTEGQLAPLLAPVWGGNRAENLRIKNGMRGCFPPGKGKGKGKAPPPRPPPPGAPNDNEGNSSGDDTTSSSSYGWTVSGRTLKPRKKENPGFLERMHRVIRRNIRRVQRIIDETEEDSPALGRLHVQLRMLHDQREKMHVALVAERQRQRAMKEERNTTITSLVNDPVRSPWFLSQWAPYERLSIVYPLGPDVAEWQVTEAGFEDHHRNMMNRIKLYRLLLTPPDESNPINDLNRVMATVDGLSLLHHHHRRQQRNYPEKGYLIHIQYPDCGRWGGAVNVSIHIKVPAVIRDWHATGKAKDGSLMHTHWDAIKMGVITESRASQLHEDARIEEYEQQIKTLIGMEAAAKLDVQQNIKRPRIEVDSTNEMETLREELGTHPAELRGTSDFPYFLRISEAMMEDMMEPLELELERESIRQLNLTFCEK